MSDRRMRSRLTRLELERPTSGTRMVVRPEDQVPSRRPVVVAPIPCRTAEEWLATYGPEATHG